MKINAINLRALMIRQGLTQKQLSELANVGRVTISNILRGCSCGQATAERLAGALNVRLEDILDS